MPIDFKIVNSDLVRIDGKTKLTSGLDEKRQSIENRLKTRLGEYFLDVNNYGLDHEKVLSVSEKKPSDDLIEIGVRQCLFQDDNVKTIDEVIVLETFRGKNISFKATLKTEEEIEGGVEVG